MKREFGPYLNDRVNVNSLTLFERLIKGIIQSSMCYFILYFKMKIHVLVHMITKNRYYGPKK